MEKWNIDVAVLIIFFKRDEQLRKTFDAVKKVRPRILLLWQDGPRNDSDLLGITSCREIVDDIDWECSVYKRYNEKNYGCDPSTFYSHKWAFSFVDKCIVLEDDFVANQSFFYFCKELLDKYEYDERVNHICGMNVLGKYECGSDYFFSATGTNAWASWKRVVDGWDESYSFLQDKKAMKNLSMKYGKDFERWHKVAEQRKATGIPYWESILGFDCLLNSRLAIVASSNMVVNNGMTQDSTHSATQLKYLTKEERQLFTLPTYELDFPIKHPNYIIEDKEYAEKLNAFFAKGHVIKKIYRKIYHLIMYIIYGEIWNKVNTKIQ